MPTKGLNLKEAIAPPHVKETLEKAFQVSKIANKRENEQLNKLLEKAPVASGLRPRYADPKPLQELNTFCEEILRKYSERSKEKELRRKRYARRHKQI